MQRDSRNELFVIDFGAMVERKRNYYLVRKNIDSCFKIHSLTCDMSQFTAFKNY